jgi:hypothetical protein
MAVHIGELSTEVIPEPEPPPGARDGGSGSGWEEVRRVRESQSALLRDRLRTAAEGFDD